MSYNSALRHETAAESDAPAQNATAFSGKATRNLREAMPLTAAFIDECRAAFGAEMVNAQIKLGMQGAETFYACENGLEVGTKITPAVKFITPDKMVILSKEEQAEKSANNMRLIR